MTNRKSPLLKPYRKNEKSQLTAQELVNRVFAPEGIYAQIEERWNAYTKHKKWDDAFMDTVTRGEEPFFTDEEGHKISGARALDPCPTVNKALSELVEICLQSYDEGVVKSFFDIANANPDYREKLKSIPLISAYSEGEMEKFYARKALERIEERYNGSVRISEQAISEIKHDAEGRVKDYLEKSGKRFTERYDEHEKMKLIVPADTADKALADDIKTARRLFRLDEAIKPFPYTHNYEHLAYGEKHLIENPAGHGNFPKSLQTNLQKVTLPPNDPEGITKRGKQIKAINPDIFGVEDLKEKYMTFVGSGALPLTGFVNHIISGCKVNLIDSDPEAVELSRKLRNHLELLGVLKREAVSIYIEDGNQVHYGGPRKNEAERLKHRGQNFKLGHSHYTFADGEFQSRDNEDVRYIPTDILYIASLIPTNVKKSIMKNLEENHKDSVPVCIVRSARGLSSMLYEPIHEAGKDIVGGSAHYHTYGSIIPERHSITYQNPHVASAEGYASPVSITAQISDDNINTAHIYYRSLLPMESSSIIFLPGSKFDEQLRKDLAEEGKEPDYSFLPEHGPTLLKHMRQELGRLAEKKGIELDTDFLDPKNLEKIPTLPDLVEAYRQICRKYTEVSKGLEI
jgi:hypothetical protein